MLFNLALEYVFQRVQVSQDSLKLNGTHQLLVYADDVHMSRGSVRIMKKNAEVLVVASKEIGLEVNVAKTKYMVMFRDQNAGQSHNIKVDNSSFESVEEFIYVRTNVHKS
jgi:hypothetical protein